MIFSLLWIISVSLVFKLNPLPICCLYRRWERRGWFVSRSFRENDGRSNSSEDGLPVTHLPYPPLFKNASLKFIFKTVCLTFGNIVLYEYRHLPEEMRNPETFKCECLKHPVITVLVLSIASEG